MKPLIKQAIEDGCKHIHPVYTPQKPPRMQLEDGIAYVYTPFAIPDDDSVWGRGHVQKARKVHECIACQQNVQASDQYMTRSEHSDGHQSYKFCLACGVDHLALWSTTYAYQSQEETPMKEQAVQTQDRPMPADVEAALVQGDLSKLTEPQRVSYYMHTCESLGLNPLTKPFAYIKIQGSLQLYARKDCTDQLRSLRHINIVSLERETIEGIFLVTATAKTPTGREDTSIGAVPIQGLKGESLANAMMKAETKAKRRVTLSICGLGFTDEAEVSSIPNAQIDDVSSRCHRTGALTSAALMEHLKEDEVVDVEYEPLNQQLVERLRGLLQDLKELEGGTYVDKLQAFEDMMKLQHPTMPNGELLTNEHLKGKIAQYTEEKAKAGRGE